MRTHPSAMIIPVRCFTCGKVIADKWNWFVQNTPVRDLKPTTVDEMAESDNSAVIASALDKLGMTRMCCRRHFLGHVEIIDDLR